MIELHFVRNKYENFQSNSQLLCSIIGPRHTLIFRFKNQNHSQSIVIGIQLGKLRVYCKKMGCYFNDG